MFKGRTSIWLAAAVACLSVAACAPEPSAPPVAEPAAPPPPEVLVDLPTMGDVTDYEDFTGRTVGTRTIEIRARVTGYLEKINFSSMEGHDVEKGFVLYEIDARPYEAEVARAKAALLQAQSHLRRLDLDYQRLASLVASKSVTREQYDLVVGDRAQAQAQVAVAEAELEMAELNLGFTKVRAPISGRVGRTMVDAGNVVKADDTILTTIVQIDPIYVYFDVDERSLLRIRRYLEEGRIKTGNGSGVQVMMGLADEADYPHVGAVNFLDNQLDPGTGTLQVRGIFRNNDRMLRPGLFSRVRLPVGDAYRALMVSEEALGTDQGEKFVYVIDEQNTAHYRRVEVGKLQQGRRVVLKGLSEGERVVVSGLQRVRPNEPVQPRAVERADKAPQPSGGPSAVAEAPTVPSPARGVSQN